MATLYINQAAGDDVNTGTQPAPVRTLGRANALANAGDLIVNEGGTFPEQVLPADSNVTWHAELDSNGQPLAHIVGDGVRARGFYISTTSRVGVTIRNYRISGQTYAGIQTVGIKGVDNDHLIDNCRIERVNGTGANQHGVRLDFGNPTVRACHISHIGPANETWGIFHGYTHSAILEDNQIHDVRKEGIRGFRDKATIRRRNRVFNCWIGIADAYSLSSLNYDNFLYWNTWGFNPKHSNSAGGSSLDAYDSWGFDPVTEPQPWSRWYHNTCWDNTGAGSVFLNADTNADGTPRGIAREVDIRNNIVGGFGADYFKDHSTGIDHSLVNMDYNVYSSRAGDVADANHYWNGFSWFTASEHLTLAGVRAKYGYETHSVRADPGLNDTGTAGDYNYPDGSFLETGGSPGAGLPHGTRRGARGVAAPRATWTHRPVTFVSAIPTTGSPSRVFDRREGTYWTAAATNSSIIGDFGAPVEINQAVADIYGHGTPANPKSYRIEVGDDPAGPWTLAEGGTNFDAFQASQKYDWPTTPAKRYVRYTELTNFGDAAKSLISEIRFGLLEYTGAPAPPDTTKPVVAARNPGAGAINVPVGAAVTATFDEPVTGVTSSSFQLLRVVVVNEPLPTRPEPVAAQTLASGSSIATAIAGMSPGAALYLDGTYTLTGTTTLAGGRKLVRKPGSPMPTITGNQQFRVYGDDCELWGLKFSQGYVLGKNIEFSGRRQALVGCDLTNSFNPGALASAGHAMVLFTTDGPSGVAEDFLGYGNRFHQIGLPGSTFQHAYYLQELNRGFFHSETHFEVHGGWAYHMYPRTKNVTVTKCFLESGLFVTMWQDVAGAVSGNTVTKCAWHNTYAGLPKPVVQGNTGTGQSNVYDQNAGFNTNTAQGGTDGIDTNYTVLDNMVADPQFASPSTGDFTITNQAVASHIGGNPTENTQVTGTITQTAPNQFVFTPSAPLAVSATYLVSLAGSSIKDAAQNALNAVSWQFTTAGVVTPDPDPDPGPDPGPAGPRPGHGRFRGIRISAA